MFFIMFSFKIDNDSALWVLTNKMPRVIYGSLNYAENNFYILRANVKDIISGSKCDVRSIIGPDENNFDSFCGHRVG